MNVMRRILALAAVGGAFALGSLAPAHADPIPYPNAGQYNGTTYTFTAAATGDVVAYIIGGFSAGYSNDIGLLDNGVQTSAGFGLNNHGSSAGDSFNLGTVTAGDTLTFVMRNNSLGAFAYSDPSMNTGYDDPGYPVHNHIYSTQYTATSPFFSGVPAGTYVAFEDLPFPGADFNYNDLSFVFTNVQGVGSAAAPEPGTFGLIAGVLAPFSGLILRRKLMAR